MKILVTGGAGFIGSHTCVELLGAGYEVVIVDNLCNSKEEAVRRIETITGKQVKFYPNSLLDEAAVERVFSENQLDAVIHFAGLKAVGESVKKAVEYYHNNLSGTLVLCEAMKRHGVKRFVFSSSATVYGSQATPPLREEMPAGSATNPYGWTKVMLEQILTDIHTADPEFSVVLLRYFNPIGAHESGLLGEDPNGIPNNLLPYISQVAIGKLDHLNVYGDDYETPDGTGIRDYIHVVDLARGHLKAVEKVMKDTGVFTYNLGTGKGYSVLEVVHAFERACGKKLPYVIGPRRPGDLPVSFADVSKAKRELGYEARYGIDKMCEDSWNFIRKNPNGL